MNRVRETYYNTGTFQRPDASGVRAGGAGWKTRPGKRVGKEFPYDDDAVMSWGQPWAYSRDSSGHGGTHQNVPVPKGIPDDDERWQKHEVTGTPISPRAAGKGGGANGGRVLPGTGGSWASGTQAVPPPEDIELPSLRREFSDPRAQRSLPRLFQSSGGGSVEFTLDELRSMIQGAVKGLLEDVDTWKAAEFSNEGTWASPMSKDKPKKKKGKGSKKKGPGPREAVQPGGYQKSEVHDMSAPLSGTPGGNLYQRQGRVDYGPYTETVVRSSLRPIMEGILAQRIAARRRG